jgi:hypothetical protein
MAFSPVEIVPQPETQVPPEVIAAAMLPERQREALVRTQHLAGAVGPELEVYTIKPRSRIPKQPGAYLFSDQVTITRGGTVMAARFELEPKILSGKVDSAHAVLPGKLSFLYSRNGSMAEGHRYVAAKGYYKRDLADRFRRMDTEIEISRLQRKAGELAFDPIAVVVAPPEYKGKGTDDSAYDLLLITGLYEGVTTMDNQPWQLGFDEANLESADSAVDALARFNSLIGKHGDAKPKNVAQGTDGRTSMIDFETSEIIEVQEPSSVAAAVHEDLTKLFSSLGEEGFFSREPYRAREVLENLGQRYVEHWGNHPADLQNMVYETVISVVESIIAEIPQPTYSVVA